MPALNGEVKADRVKPTKGAKQLPGVLVIYESRRLNPYINKVARRLAKPIMGRSWEMTHWTLVRRDV